jgi:hypothetical protein
MSRNGPSQTDFSDEDEIDQGIESDYDDEEQVQEEEAEENVEAHENSRGNRKGKNESEEDSDKESASRKKKSTEPSFMDTKIHFMICGSLEDFGNEEKCRATIKHLNIVSTKDGKPVVVSGPQLLKSIDIIDIKNNSRVSVGITPEVKGMEPQPEYFSHSASGVTANAFCRKDEKRKNISEAVFRFDTNKGLKFMENYPGFTIDDIRKELATIKGFVVAHKSHPLPGLLRKLKEEEDSGSSKRKKSGMPEIGDMPEEHNEFYHIPTDQANIVIRTLQADMKKFMPLVNSLQDISVKIAPAYPIKKLANGKEEISGNPWINNDEIRVLPDKFKEEARRAPNYVYVTLKVTHCPAKTGQV